jgi:hypothetical protein
VKVWVGPLSRLPKVWIFEPLEKVAEARRVPGEVVIWY